MHIALNMTKSPGCDVPHPRILRELSSVIAYSLKIIIDCSFHLKKLPMDWLSVDVTVVYKKGNKSELMNYRPTSLTCICCKLLESIIRDHTVSYLSEKNYLVVNSLVL